ncbi:endoplasmic reticulum vesicle transporter-domain-containing protein [Pilobolus umbonatus]|nr:endoplasmic reticulum vesicle transporter-domain-containing protein [Pilobolus umbonatus]
MAFRSLITKAASIDAFPKVEDDNQQRSEKGGILTVMVAICLFLLTVTEYRDYRRLEPTYKFLVDSSIDSKMQINIDVTVAMPCQSVKVHIFDASGQRTALTDYLKLVPVSFFLPVEDPKYIHEIIQAANGKSYDHQIASDMGACRVFGSVQTNRVASNLHLTSAGHGYASDMHTNHEALNFTHRIDEFSFGELYPNIINPLDNSVEIAETNFEIFHYAISVVPTVYKDKNGHVLYTNQYAVTDTHKTFEEGRAVPGIFFNYDIEPISVRISEIPEKSFIHFLVRLCGILGGVVVSVGAIYRTINLIMTGGREDPKLYTDVHHMMRHI